MAVAYRHCLNTTTIILSTSWLFCDGKVLQGLILNNNTELILFCISLQLWSSRSQTLYHWGQNTKRCNTIEGEFDNGWNYGWNYEATWYEVMNTVLRQKINIKLLLPRFVLMYVSTFNKSSSNLRKLIYEFT